MKIKDYFGRETEYYTGAYNKFNKDVQYIRLSDGCPNNCPYCYAPQEMKVYPIPEIIRNDVKIMDDNLTAKPESMQIIRELGEKRVNGKVVYYELICGIDFRFMTPQMAKALKKSRFKKIRLAWDWGFKFQKKIKETINMLKKVGYQGKDIMVFILCNWKVPYVDNCRKLDLLKIWNVEVSDCYYDNQISPDIKPIYWKESEIKDFRKSCRKHNQMIIHEIDPEYSLDHNQGELHNF